MVNIISCYSAYSHDISSTDRLKFSCFTK